MLEIACALQTTAKIISDGVKNFRTAVSLFLRKHTVIVVGKIATVCCFKHNNSNNCYKTQTKTSLRSIVSHTVEWTSVTTHAQSWLFSNPITMHITPILIAWVIRAAPQLTGFWQEGVAIVEVDRLVNHGWPVNHCFKSQTVFCGSE